MAGLSAWHLLILLMVVVLLFGATRLPNLARGIGQSVRIFKGELKATTAKEHTPVPPPAPAASPDLDQPPSPSSHRHMPPEQ
jgi:sec-independent protein translocase protein TatA